MIGWLSTVAPDVKTKQEPTRWATEIQPFHGGRKPRPLVRRCAASRGRGPTGRGNSDDLQSTTYMHTYLGGRSQAGGAAC